jgi:hypothetical protein
VDRGLYDSWLPAKPTRKDCEGTGCVASPVRGKKIVAKKGPTRATVENALRFEEFSLKHNKSVRLLLGAALTVVAAYVVVVRMDRIRANVSQRDSIQYWAGES